MSAPAHNPDRRPLPDGWITRYDDRYTAWYYVDTRAQPPRSSWDHPLGPPPPPPGNYPAGNPLYHGSPQPLNQQPNQPSPAQPFNQPQSYSGGAYQGNQRDTRPYQPQPQGFHQSQPNYGGPPPGNYGGNSGWQQWQQPPPQGYPAAQPPVQTLQQPPRGGGGRGLGGGLGAAALAGGAGLLGGVALTEAFEHHEHREEERAYDQGFGDGQDNNFGGGDFSGGDW